MQPLFQITRNGNFCGQSYPLFKINHSLILSTNTFISWWIQRPKPRQEISRVFPLSRASLCLSVQTSRLNTWSISWMSQTQLRTALMPKRPASRRVRHEVHPCTSQWVMCPCTSQWVLEPCTSQWELHSCTSQWVLHPCTSQWELHPYTSQWELHPCASQWVLHTCTSQWVLHPCIYKSMGAGALHKSVGAASLHKSMGCIPAQVNGCCIPAQVNGCCIPTQVNGSCTPTQVNGCCIPAQVNGALSLHKPVVPTQFHWPVQGRSTWRLPYEPGWTRLWIWMGERVHAFFLHQNEPDITAAAVASFCICMHASLVHALRKYSHAQIARMRTMQ